MKSVLIILFLFLAPTYWTYSQKGYEPKRYMKKGEYNLKSKKNKTTIVGSKQSAGKKNQKAGFVGKSPSKKQKKVKYGFVGSDPSVNVNALNTKQMIVGGSGKSKIKGPKKNRIIKEGKNATASAKSSKNPGFIKASNPKNSTKRIKGIKINYELQGEDPGVRVNKVKEKRVYDVQFRSAYKFNKSGRKNIQNKAPE